MAHYLVQFTYSQDGLQAMVLDEKKQLIMPAVGALGGKVHASYLCFGDYDGVAVVEVPDNVSAAALSLVLRGGIAQVKTTPLMTVEEGSKVLSKASEVIGSGGDD